MSEHQPLIVIQITDTHLFADRDREMMGLKTAHSFRAVLDRIRELNLAPDVFLLTGDLSQDETPESYEYLQSLITSFDIPTYWIPGNHDNPDAIVSILTHNSIRSDKSFDLGNWHFILLNSQCPGKVYGDLSSASLQQLESQLEHNRDRPTFIALHHHPIAIASEWMDEINLRNSDEFLAIIDRHPQVKIVICGHIHQEFETTRNGVIYLGCPSTCVQFKPRATELTFDETATPGFRVFTLHADGEYTSKVERTNYQLPRYPNPRELQKRVKNMAHQ
ncbi:3',5'-cyclic-AMP phosphodiesterase [Lyngbya sp. CCY1209]|uniref:3',5'-cyclic-AMP phosphodiesterase n=1 Tax=Lyngbya sp. CCY1209 TaxID=2886103 RepID=UPI002D1FEFD3|nr:3',5'-cyclic-AMP phosphodiesterase [Lyngbya sp. CCY1209]MEB3886553.1 3',5'-cyclic-AMP phosphodiesterase [Lyngbya sp. CCY1209]